MIQVHFIPGQPKNFDEIEDLYFAYGSNMNPFQLSKRCAGAHAIAPARLDHHKLSFYGYSEEWDGAIETVDPSEGNSVWGILFSLRGRGWDQLDQWMDARLDGGGMYFHFPIVVTDIHGVQHRCRLYKKDVCDEPSLPSTEYLQHIVKGAREHHLPTPYIDALCALPCKPASYAVPVRCGADLGMNAGHSCKECSSAAPILVQEGPLCVLPSI